MNQQTSWHVCILIPACNEEELLPRCLHSVLNACVALPVRCTHEIVLVVDASTDRSFELGEALIKGHGIVTKTNKANVGAARKLAAEVALSRYNGPLNQCWLANTDADCEVPVDWLCQQVDLAENDVEAVAGIIDVDSFVEHKAHVSRRFHLTYELRADGTHTHVHGANMGVRADAFIRAGGWQPLRTAEDHDLWHRLYERGCHVSATTSLYVITSGRRVGRAPNGFADRLAMHDEMAPL